MKSLFLLLASNLLGIYLLHATGDTLYPEVGKPCPEFLLKNVNYYKKKEVKLSDFKGKWLVLDFWNKYCSACVASFPKVNAMQKKFASDVRFVLVGIQDPEGNIKAMYERFQKRNNLELACAFDSTLSNYWGIVQTPHIIVVDNKGIVQAVTTTVDSIAMQKLLKGEHPDLPTTYFAQTLDGPDINEYRVPFEASKPYMLNDNGAMSNSAFLFRSVLTKWGHATQNFNSPRNIYIHAINPAYPKGMFQTLGATVEQLYQYAYIGASHWTAIDTLLYGIYSQKTVFELNDSSLFQTNKGIENMFCYSIILPEERGSKENLQKAMQKDLETFFGFNAFVEIRKIPCWRLIATEDATEKLTTKGAKPGLTEIIPRVSYKISNWPMKWFVQYLGQFAGQSVIIDETGITQNIDITTDCIDLESVKTFLPKYGLTLIPAEKEMKVLVIRDKM